MIREIIKDPLFLARKSLPATALDLPVARDLRDTLAAHRAGCVGMAANMIGVLKRIIIFADGLSATVMLNPEITKKTGPYETEEGCLSLEDTHQVKRFQRIRVKFQDEDFNWQTKSYRDWTAQIIQHEIDHCNGVVV